VGGGTLSHHLVQIGKTDLDRAAIRPDAWEPPLRVNRQT